jgi:multicomponent Na+:H+ antiporter subunit D
VIAISLNPGFALLLAAVVTFVAPKGLRTIVMLAGAIGALFMMFAPGFGDQVALAQIGLAVTPLRLDALGQVFGLGFGLIAAILALFSDYKRDRLEGVALLTQAGGAVTAVFAGDLISFIAGAQLGALAGVALAANGRTPQALGAAIRMSIWQGLAGLLMVAGAGFIWSAGGSVDFDQMDLQSPGAAMFLVALLIMAGAPLAHVWIKDAAANTTPTAAAALAVFPLSVALYALLRAFPGEPVLLLIGEVMALAPLPLAATTKNLKQSLAYGLVSQAGIVIIGIGAATPLALAGSAAFAFACMVQSALAFMAIGFAYERSNGAIGGLARSMPMTALMAIIAGLSALGAPLFAGFAGQAVISGAISREGLATAWLVITAASAGAVLHAGLRAPFEVFFGRDGGARPADAPFGVLLAMGLAAFFVVSVGVNPAWLYALLPDQINFRPLEIGQALTQAQLIVAGALVFGLAKRFALYPTPRSGEIPDVDWLYRGPLRAGARGLIAAAAWLSRTARAQASAVRRRAREAAHLLRHADRPPGASGADALWILAAAAFFLIFLYAWQL